jgi:putative oxidoreductase
MGAKSHRRSRSRSRDRDGVGAAQALLRTSLGGTMLAHGIRHGRNLDGTAGWFSSIGFRQPRLQAQASAVVEVLSGSALLLGFATPIAASAVVGTMVVAAESVHRPNGYFITDEGWEYVALISAAAVGLGALGPGRLSVDRLLGVDRPKAPFVRSGAMRALVVAGVGVTGAAMHLKAWWSRPAG